MSRTIFQWYFTGPYHYHNQSKRLNHNYELKLLLAMYLPNSCIHKTISSWPSNISLKILIPTRKWLKFDSII